MRFSILLLDANECSASVPMCDVNADCKNTLGSYRCSCKPGFTGDGKTCGKRVGQCLSMLYFFFLNAWLGSKN